MEKSKTNGPTTGATEVESMESSAKTASSKKQQIIKYAAVWVALVAAFFIVNMVIKSVVATGNVQNQGGYYTSSIPASNNYAVQADLAPGAGFGSCGAGGACCGTSSQATGEKTNFKQLEKVAIDWYTKTYGDSNVTAEVKDFGCHQQVNILKDGKVIKELEYRNGQLRPIN
ncbi:MAG: hypothetical protein K6T91_07815 [Firmicutes bacterium]|nr:hypothetical protein [Bacillota bacterium]